MGIIKLVNEGDTHTMLIADCKEVAGNYGAQVLFSDGTDSLYLPKESADRQLTRMGADYSSVEGLMLTFSRDPNPKKGAKPYWGISYAGTEAPANKASPRVEAPKSASSTNNPVQPRRDAILAQYLMLWDTIAGHFQVVCDNRNITLDASAIQAAVATVWISWKDKGLQPDGLPDAKPVEQPPEIKMPAPSGKRLAPPVVPDARPGDDDLPF
jgi:hypothetical protein